MSNSLDLANPGRPIHVGVILMKGETELLDIAPVDFLHSLSTHFLSTIPPEFIPPGLRARAPPLDFTFHWVSEAGPATPSRLTSGISLTPTDSFETCPPLDIVLVGAHTMGYEPSAAELAFVRRAWAGCAAFITVCGGVEVPLRAGILAGRTATGPRFLLEGLRRQAPDTEWVERRWVRDGKLWTSGALLNGMDLMHAFALEVWGGGEGEESLASWLGKGGAWPSRDVDYKDVPWDL